MATYRMSFYKKRGKRAHYAWFESDAADLRAVELAFVAKCRTHFEPLCVIATPHEWTQFELDNLITSDDARLTQMLGPELAAQR